MLKKKALVTGVGGDIGQSVIKCLKDTGYDIELIGCDVDFYAAGKKSCKKFFQSPWAIEAEEYLNFIQKLIAEEGVNYIFPTTEPEIEFYDKYRDYFRNKNLTIFINDSNIIKTFLDKYETVNFLRDNKLPYPETYTLETYNGELPFPVLLKQRKGSGAKGLKIINDEEELIFFKRKMSDAIVQEIIGSPDEEYTVGVFSTSKEVYSITLKRHLGYGSLTKVAQLVHDDKIKIIAERVANACSLNGVLNIQLRRRCEDYYVPFEINPRISSTVYFRHFFGFQDVKWWIDLKENRSVEYTPKYKNGIAVRTIGEVFFDLKKSDLNLHDIET